ncbi:MAG TPA: hypothetical protein ENI11_02855 [Actinobacteria bacterium]|nr:hypothetical protein [Actinomycetota bacterium]
MTNLIKKLFRQNIAIRAWVVVLGLAVIPYTVHAIAISALVALTGANSASGDLIAIVDVSEAVAADRTKKITRDELAKGLALATSNLVVVAEIDTEGELETVSNITNILRETEIDASSELLTIMDDETGTGLLVFGTSPTFLTGITVPANSISDDELDEGANFTWTGVHDYGGATSLEVPSADAPTVNADGEIALDTLITDHTDLLIYRGGDAVEDKLIIAIPRDQLTATDGHVIAYNAADNEFEMVAGGGGSGDITDVFACATGDCASITMAATDLLDMSGTDASTATEGLILPQHATACAGGTAEGQVCWEADDKQLYVGDGAALVPIRAHGWILIETVIASDQATVEFKTDIDSVYHRYKIVVSNGLPVDDQQALLFRMSDDAGVSFEADAGDYDWIIIGSESDGTVLDEESASATFIRMTSSVSIGIGNGSAEGFMIEIYIDNPSNAAQGTKIHWDMTYTTSTGTHAIEKGGGAIVAAAAINGFHFLMGTGNMSSGTFSLYGLRE